MPPDVTSSALVILTRIRSASGFKVLYCSQVESKGKISVPNAPACSPLASACEDASTFPNHPLGITFIFLRHSALPRYFSYFSSSRVQLKLNLILSRRYLSEYLTVGATAVAALTATLLRANETGAPADIL